MNESYEKTKSLLISKRAALERIAGILLEKETIDGGELRRLLKEEGGEAGHAKENQNFAHPYS